MLLHVAAPDTNSPRGALTSLVAAQRRARAAGPGTVVEVGPGIHRLEAPLVFDARDAGITWRAAPGVHAVLSGCRRITAWTPVTVHGRAAWQADVAGLPPFTQLWADGERRSWPMLPMSAFTGLDGQTDVGQAWHRGPRRAAFRPGELDPTWHRLDEVRLTCYQLWFETHHRIARIEADRSVVHFRAPSLGSLIDEQGAFARFQAGNVFEAFTEPGTWYRDGDRLLYLPRPGEDPALLVVEVPVVPRLVEVRGTRARPVAGLRFEHLHFHGAEFDLAPDDVGDVQAAWRVPGAITLAWAEDTVFHGVTVAGVGGYGLQVGTGCTRTVISACHLHDLGAGGVRIDHEELAPHESAIGTPQPRVRPEPQAATVIDTVIGHGGRRFPSCVGIFIGNAGHNRICHNHLHDLPYTGISLGWTWGYAPTATVGNRIEDNRIERINVERLLSDNGAIYTLGRQPGGIIAGNRIEGVGCYGYGGWGIYPDAGSSELAIHGNVVRGTRHAGFHCHYGAALDLTDNVFLDGDEAHVRITRGETHRTMTVTGGVWCASRGGWAPTLATDPAQVLWRRLVLHDPRRPALDDATRARLERQGQHLGTVLADPGLGYDLVPRAGGPAASLAAVLARARAAGVRPATRRAGPRLPTRRPQPVIETRLERQGEAEAVAGGRTRVTWRITWRNPGLVPARLAVRLVPGRGNRLVAGTAPRPTRLAPGASLSVTAVVEVRRGVPLARLETVPVAGPARPHLVFLALARQAALALPALPRADAAALAALPAVATAWGLGDEVCARVHLARTPQGLALLAEVADARIHQGAKPWEGSAIEVFTALPTGNAKAGQVILVPSVPGVPGAAWSLTKGLAATAIPVHDERTPTGYRLWAVLPPEVLGVNPHQPFRLELAVAAARTAAGQPERSSWVAAPAPHARADGLASITPVP